MGDVSGPAHIDEEFLSMLACPLCGGALRQESSKERHQDVLVCSGCGGRFPIRNGIPVLLAEERLADS